MCVKQQAEKILAPPGFPYCTDYTAQRTLAERSRICGDRRSHFAVQERAYYGVRSTEYGIPSQYG